MTTAASLSTALRLKSSSKPQKPSGNANVLRPTPSVPAKPCAANCSSPIIFPNGPPAGTDQKYLDAYPEERRPPLGRALSVTLADESEYLKRFPGWDVGDLKRVAWHYEDTLSRNRLMKRIKEEVHANKIASPVVHALAALDFPLVMTTNYDQLFEQSLRAAGKDPQLCVYSPSAKNPTEDPTDDPTPL